MIEMCSTLTLKSQEDIVSVFFINVVKIEEKTYIACYILGDLKPWLT